MGFFPNRPHHCHPDHSPAEGYNVNAGMQAGADIYMQPRNHPKDALATPAGWATLWFGLSTLYLLGIYYGMFKITR